jgi:hypothetical protein
MNLLEIRQIWLHNSLRASLKKPSNVGLEYCTQQCERGDRS